MVILQILFWLSVLSMFHSYVLYPWLLKLLARGRTGNQLVYEIGEELPDVMIFMSVYNEEHVIEQKLNSLMQLDYPSQKWKIYIGSDGSTDATDQIMEKYQQKIPQLQFSRFGGRNGKPAVLNMLVEQVRAQDQPQHENKKSIFIFTDANVLFESQTVFQLVKHFKNPQVGLVGAQVINRISNGDGIAFQEKSYISRENEMKHLEGICWGTAMGAFGACYAMDAALFKTFPANFIVEDFYITMKVLEAGKQSIHEPEAICIEDVPGRAQEEFRRKARISAGNFQNLRAFFHLLFPPFSGLAFSFLSHKVLRWLGPFFIIIAFISSAVLAVKSSFYLLMFLLQVFLLLLPAIDLILRKAGKQSVILRFISYFYYMNLALLVGFIKFCKGVKTNVWQPTKRSQA